MNQRATTLALDRRALALLEPLLEDSAGARAARLAALRDTDPELHARLTQLLHAASDADASRALAEPLHGAWQSGRARLQPGALIAGYRLLRPLGEGGMASVWLAERADGGLKREVALKLPLAPWLSSTLAERFARERDVLATLDHPNIARLFDAGVSEAGQPYIVLEHVDGITLTEFADSRRLSTRQKLALFVQVLAAVEHAHGRMVVHRDLKPGNILVNQDGQVKLLDFGIAKLLAAEPASALTQEAAAVLTPRYAAPEQVLGQPVSAATDIYSAGVVLYELLAGSLPYERREPDSAEQTLALMQAVVHEPARPPCIDTDIDTVLLKALAKEPAQRYASIERFAEDLRRLLDRRPILARRVPLWRRSMLLMGRHRLATAAVAAGSAALVVAAGLAWQQSLESAAQHRRAEAVREFVFRMVADAEPAEGRSEVTGVEMVDAAVERARRDVSDARLRGELLAALGQVYWRLRQTGPAQSTLAESLALLEAQAPPADPALNQARAAMARAVQEQDGPRATALALQVLAQCTSAGPDCAKARSEADLSLSANEGWAGHAPAALGYARDLVREAAAGYGEASTEMVSGLEMLAAAARNLGHLSEAAAAIERARTIAARLTMRATGRARLDLSQAVIDFDRGRYVQAQAQLKDLLDRPALWYERATQWRMLAGVETALGHEAAAMAAAEASIKAMPPDWSATAQASFSRQLWAVAASKAGRHPEALAAFAQARADLARVHYDATSPAVLRLRRHEAEARLRAGQTAAGAAALLELYGERARSTKQPEAVEDALVRASLGCAQALLGHPDQAAAQFDAAAPALAAALPPDHPLQRRVGALREAADCRGAL